MTTANLLKLEMKRTYAVSPQRLFAAWTEPDQITQWFGCNGTQCLSAKIDREVGGDFRIDTISDKHGKICMCGEIRTFEPHSKLAFTFVWSGNEEVESMPPTLVTLNFKEVKGGTELEIVHSEIPCEEMGDSFKHGWAESLEKLQSHIA